MLWKSGVDVLQLLSSNVRELLWCRSVITLVVVVVKVVIVVVVVVVVVVALIK